jgi:predicted amidophosphoribosyltransferase
MRNRHVPRLCAACQSPMSAQSDECWKCGAVWVDTEAPALALVPPPAEPVAVAVHG